MPNSNKSEIKNLAVEMLTMALPKMEELIEKALNSGALDIDSWDSNSNPMILPKTILIAVLETEAEQYKCKGSSFEKPMNKEIKNLKYFL